jgi:CHAT domain-containing protein
VQQQLSPDEVMLEYVLTEPRSYCLVISRRGTKLVPLQARSIIEGQVEQFASALKGAGGNSPQAAKALFDALLQPIPDSRTAKRLFVVPDGRLNLVPFDALLSLNGVSSTIVSTVPSANVFFLLRTRPRRAATDGPLLAIGGVPYEQMFDRKTTGPESLNQNRGLFDASYPVNLPALGSARAEVLSAARALGPDSVVLVGDGATEAALKSQDLGRFGILHFAAHAFADPKFPERAAIVLLNNAAAGEDGLLQPREIAQFRLKAGVVVLSACDTAVGPTLGQEGVLNIARGFLLAGAQSVVMTLWPVTDATSSALMRRFYENIAAGQDVAQALAGSKSAVLEQFGTAALPSVAAFQLVGVGDYRVPRSKAGAYD